MRWLVEILNIEDDENIIKAALEKAGYRLVKKRNNNVIKLFLNHSKYEQFDDSHSVYQDSQQISERIQRFFSLESKFRDFKIFFGSIHEMSCDRKVNKYAFLTGNIILPSIVVSGILEVKDEIPQKQRSESAKASLEQQRKRRIIYLGTALNNPKVLDVIELLNIEKPSSTELVQ